MTELVFSVHAEIKGKGRARANWKQRVVHTPAATVRYERLVASEAKEAMRRGALASFGAGVAVQMDMIIRLAPPKSASKALRARMLAGEVRPTKKPDVDNVVKAVGDALNGVAFADDVQIAVLNVERIYAPSEGLDVRIRKAGVPAWMSESSG